MKIIIFIKNINIIMIINGKNAKAQPQLILIAKGRKIAST